MIDVTTDWWIAVAIAGVVGMLGGLVNELISSHSAAELSLGRVERPGGKGLQDLGFWASMIVGAVAAISFLYFLEPKSVTVGDVITREYDGIKLVAASLLIGSGGPAVLKSMRERLLRVHSESVNDAASRVADNPSDDPAEQKASIKAIQRILADPSK